MQTRRQGALWPIYVATSVGSALCALLLSHLMRPAKSEQGAQAEALPDTPAEPAAHRPSSAAHSRARAQAVAARKVHDAVPQQHEAGPEAEDEAERDLRAIQEREVDTLYKGLVKQLALAPPDPGLAPEAVGNYVAGVLQTLEAVDMDLLPVLSERMNDRMCDSAVPENELATLAFMGSLSNHLGNQAGLSCVLARGREDVVLWRALDAWRAQKLPQTQAFRELATSARDVRTLVRMHGDPRLSMEENMRNVAGEPQIIHLAPEPSP